MLTNAAGLAEFPDSCEPRRTFADQESNPLPRMPTDAPPPADDAYNQWLVIRAQSGEEDALEELVERWSPRLGRHAMRLTGNADGAAEAAQEAWLGIVRGLDRLDDPACFRRWAYQIVARRCADWIRRRQRSRNTTEPLTDEPPTPAADNTTTDRRDAVRRMLKSLPRQDQALLAMHYSDGMPLAEIAEAAGLPVGTVKSRLYHARQRLKSAIERDQENP